MPLDALEAGPAWDWRTFGECLDRLDGRLARQRRVPRRPLDDAAGRDGRRRRRAAPPPRSRSRRWCGCCTSRSTPVRSASRRRWARRHTDGDGQPGAVARGVATRSSSRSAGAVRDHAGTTLEFIAAMGEIAADRMELMADMSLAADRPLNWNLLGSLSPTEVYEQQLHVVRPRHATQGAHVVALTLPDLMRMRAQRHARRSCRAGARSSRSPDDERRRAVADPDGARPLRAGAEEAATAGSARSPSCDLLEIADAPAGRSWARSAASIADVAAERGHRSRRRADRRRAPRSPAAHDWCSRRSCRRSADPTRAGGSGRERVARRPHRARRLRRRRAPRPDVPRELHDRWCSASRCATGGCSRWRRPSASSPTCPRASTGCATAAASPRAGIADLVVFDPDRIGSGPTRGAPRPARRRRAPLRRGARHRARARQRPRDRRRAGVLTGDLARHVAAVRPRHRHRHRPRQPITQPMKQPIRGKRSV